MTGKQLLLYISLFVFTVPCASYGQKTTQRSPDEMVAFHGGSGSALLRQCQAAVRQMNGEKPGVQEAPNATYCYGYVEGVVDAMTGFSLHQDTVYCILNTSDRYQLIRVVTKYLNDHPATLNNPAGALVSNAMIDAFPCK
jgi:hypothetical protein